MGARSDGRWTNRDHSTGALAGGGPRRRRRWRSSPVACLGRSTRTSRPRRPPSTCGPAPRRSRSPASPPATGCPWSTRAGSGSSSSRPTSTARRTSPTSPRRSAPTRRAPARRCPPARATASAPALYTIRNEDTRPVQVTKKFRVDALDDHPSTALYDLQKGDIGPKGTDRPGSATSPCATASSSASTSACPVRPTRARTRPSSSTRATARRTPTPPSPARSSPASSATPPSASTCAGTGCSSGVFDVFNAAQQADGYDVIEAIARQDWVLNHKPGMVGLSYSGITQLYTAATQPPHLAAVTSLSVIKDPWLQQWPGGVYNGGFTREWLAERDRQSSAGGTSWVQKRIDGGDTACAAAPDGCASRTSTSRTSASRSSTGRRTPTPATSRSWCARSTCPCTSPAPGRTSRPAPSSPTCSTSSRTRR